MRFFLTTIPFSACFACGALSLFGLLPPHEAANGDYLLIEQEPALAEFVEPPPDADGCLLAVQQAVDPATAEDAWRRGIELGADRLTLNQNYVRQMISLGLPGQAEEAAEQIVDVYPHDGVAWAVLAYADAARNDTTAALAEIAMAVDWALTDPFVLGVAGKLMAWYHFPGLGDPAELPEGLPERLDEIHVQLSVYDTYRTAYEAAYAFYQSQAEVPIPEYPEEIVEPAFAQIVYTPNVCTTYNEYVYSGFTVPCFSVSYLVPRVRCYVFYERPVHRHLRFHIGDRCHRYHDRCHARRLNWERVACCAAYHLAGRIRLASRPGLHLPRVHARYDRDMFASRRAAPLARVTNPPSPTPRRIAELASGRSHRALLGRDRSATPHREQRTDSHGRGSGGARKVESPDRDRAPARPSIETRLDSQPQGSGAVDRPARGVDVARRQERRQGTDQAAPRTEHRKSEPRTDSGPRARSEHRKLPSAQSPATDQGHRRDRTVGSKPKSDARPQPQAGAVPQAKDEPKPQPRVEPKPQPKNEPKPQPKVEPKPQPKVDIRSAPGRQPRAETKSERKPQPKIEPRSDPKPQPKSDPRPQPKTPTPAFKVEKKPDIKPNPKPAPSAGSSRPEAKSSPKSAGGASSAQSGRQDRAQPRRQDSAQPSRQGTPQSGRHGAAGSSRQGGAQSSRQGGAASSRQGGSSPGKQDRAQPSRQDSRPKSQSSASPAAKAAPKSAPAAKSQPGAKASSSSPAKAKSQSPSASPGKSKSASGGAQAGQQRKSRGK